MFSGQCLDEPVLAEFYGYWQGLHQTGKLPRRSDIGSLDLPQLPLPLGDDRDQATMVLAGAVFADGQPQRRQTVFHSHRYFTSSLFERINLTPDQDALGA